MIFVILIWRIFSKFHFNSIRIWRFNRSFTLIKKKRVTNLEIEGKKYARKTKFVRIFLSQVPQCKEYFQNLMRIYCGWWERGDCLKLSTNLVSLKSMAQNLNFRQNQSPKMSSNNLIQLLFVCLSPDQIPWNVTQNKIILLIKFWLSQVLVRLVRLKSLYWLSFVTLYLPLIPNFEFLWQLILWESMQRSVYLVRVLVSWFHEGEKKMSKSIVKCGLCNEFP